MADTTPSPEQTPEAAPVAFELPEVDIEKHRKFNFVYDRPLTEEDSRMEELAHKHMKAFFDEAEGEGLVPHNEDSRNFTLKGIGEMAVLYRKNGTKVDDSLGYASKLDKGVEKHAHDAFHDELTGVLNRRGFDREISQNMGNIRRNKATFYVIDLNGLTEVNNEKGHPVGDKVIQGAANVLSNTTRDGDIVARTGGDEFLVVTFDGESDEDNVFMGKRGVAEENPEANSETDVIKAFSSRVASETFEYIDGIGEELGIDLDDLELAIGGLKWDSSRSFEEVYKEADALMYRDKEQKYAAKGKVPLKAKKPTQ